MKAYLYNTYFSCGECWYTLTNEKVGDSMPIRHPINDKCSQSGKLFEQPEVELKEAKR